MFKRIFTFVGLTLALSLQLINAQPVIEEPIYGNSDGDRHINNTEIAPPKIVKNTFTKATTKESSITKGEQIKTINIFNQEGILMMSFDNTNLESYKQFIQYLDPRETYKIETITNKRRLVETL